MEIALIKHHSGCSQRAHSSYVHQNWLRLTNRFWPTLTHFSSPLIVEFRDRDLINYSKTFGQLSVFLFIGQWASPKCEHNYSYPVSQHRTKLWSQACLTSSLA